MEYITCCICGSHSSKQRFNIAGYTIVSCETCSLFYVNPQPGKKELEEFYDKDYHNKSWYVTQFPQLSNFDHFEKTPEEVDGYKSYITEISKYKAIGRLLDVGCGNGWLLKHARDFGFNVFGIEPTKTAFNEAVKRIGDNVFNTTLNEACFNDNYFDVVTLIGTIEHVKKPLELLQEINRILKKGGILLLQTPNVDSYLAKRQKEKWEQFTPPGHLYYFSPKSMKMLLEKVGLRVIKFDMRIPLFAPLDYGSFYSKDSKSKNNFQIAQLSSNSKEGSVKILNPYKSILKHFLKPPYDWLSQLKGKIIGKHDMIVYATKVNCR